MDHSLYCGITTDVIKRVNAHNSGKGAKYTRSRKPVRLVASSEYVLDHSAAARCEHAFKKLTRTKKLFFIKKGLGLFLSQYENV